MKILLPITFFIFGISCTADRGKKEEKIKPVISTITLKKTDQIEDGVDTILHLTDSTFNFKNYSLTVDAIDSVYIPPLYKDAKIRDDIYRKHGNLYEAAKDLEKYLQKSQSQYFKRQDSVLTLVLSDGKTKELKDISKDSDEDIWYTYQNYFPEVNSYLVRGQLYEGDCYLVVNRETGRGKYILGEIYPDPSNRFLAAINNDMEAGYSGNGLQMIELKDGGFVNRFSIEGGSWGPIGLKWVDNSSFVIKVLERSDNESFKYSRKFYKLTFH